MPKFIPPQEIEITSDGSVLEFVKMKPITTNQKEVMYQYRYTAGFEKVGLYVDWTETYITKQLGFFFKKLK